ncbi:MAG: c-type cytochrome, partial [Pseudomonadales bacterium]|nr:c-type cytochrome [Pseudomonadales bacterium]
MSSAWHWFIVIGTIVSIFGVLLLLFGNRKITGEETTGHVWDGIEELDNPLPMWWVGMFVASVVFGLAYLVWYPGLGNVEGYGQWSAHKQLQEINLAHEERFAPLYAELGAMDVETMLEDRRAAQVGRRLFLNRCAVCHGPNAQGVHGFPNLSDKDWTWGGRFEDIKASIKNGRVASMPGWGGALGCLLYTSDAAD